MSSSGCQAITWPSACSSSLFTFLGALAELMGTVFCTGQPVITVSFLSRLEGLWNMAVFELRSLAVSVVLLCDNSA